ncbi:MAG: DNA-binding response regulator [Calothrix sp. MO_167.B42]|nr:DNA-binding response regulator [Calothrix sp. MO_167.B42]
MEVPYSHQNSSTNLMHSHTPLFLVIEDHPEVAQNNCCFLQKVEASANCICVETPEQGLERLKLEMPELVVVDLQFGTISGEQSAKPGIELLRQIFEQYPNLNILVYTSDSSFLIHLVNFINKHHGGFVVVNKMELRKAFIEGAQSALKGELRIPRELRQEMKLTEKELEALKLLCQYSLTDHAIAERMHVALRTAQNYVQRLKEKLDIDSWEDSTTSARVAVCMEAVRRKLLLL